VQTLRGRRPQNAWCPHRQRPGQAPLATKAVTEIDFGLVGLSASEFGELTGLLTKVRRAADFLPTAP